MGDIRFMNPFVLTWLIGGVCLFHVMILVRHLMHRQRSKNVFNDLLTCVILSFLLIPFIIEAGIKIYLEDKFKEKKSAGKKRKKLVPILSRWEILDL